MVALLRAPSCILSSHRRRPLMGSVCSVDGDGSRYGGGYPERW